MKVLEYLNTLCIEGNSESTALGILEKNYSIKYSIWEELGIPNIINVNGSLYNEF